MVNVFAACKIVNLNPNMAEFMTSTLFVFEPKTKRMAAIHFTFEDQQPKTLELVSCNEGPDTFKQLLDKLNSEMDKVPDKVAMLCMEKLPGAKKVGEFGAAHVKEVFDPATIREIEKTFVTIVEGCFSKAKKST